MPLVFDRVCRRYGALNVLKDFSYSFPEGSVTCVLGPSGCGKTTLLRLAAGLEKPDSGTVSLPPGSPVSMVFQENRLFENLTALKNVLLTAAPGFRRSDAVALLAELGLGANANRRTAALSGGMKRRVALARALAAEYEWLLMDEPLSGLDPDTGRSALACIKKMTAGRTVIYVTHNVQEADALGADRLVLPSLQGLPSL